jgi:hypothetical protein
LIGILFFLFLKKATTLYHGGIKSHDLKLPTFKATALGIPWRDSISRPKASTSFFFPTAQLFVMLQYSFLWCYCTSCTRAYDGKFRLVYLGRPQTRLENLPLRLLTLSTCDFRTRFSSRESCLRLSNLCMHVRNVLELGKMCAQGDMYIFKNMSIRDDYYHLS